MSTATSFCDNLQTSREEQVVLILVGVIGSGKSTFAQALEDHLPRQFRRCNQDDLGNRNRVENLARRTLREGLSVCIDRTNFNAAQRSYWINIAREFPGTVVWVIVFETSYEVCAARLRGRMCNKAPNAWLSPGGVAEKHSIGTFHPTIKSPEQGLSVLARFANDFQPPLPHEGYDRLIVLRSSDHPSPIYTLTDITAILQRLQDSTSVTSLIAPSTSSWTSGNSPFQGDLVRGGNNRRLNGMPRGRRASPYSINSRGRTSPFRHGAVASAGGFARSRSTASRSNNPQRGTESRPSRGGTSDSPNWRGNGSAENPLTIT